MNSAGKQMSSGRSDDGSLLYAATLNGGDVAVGSRHGQGRFKVRQADSPEDTSESAFLSLGVRKP